MKGKYITTQILLACKAKAVNMLTTVRDQKVFPDELKQVVKPNIGISSLELVAA